MFRIQSMLLVSFVALGLSLCPLASFADKASDAKAKAAAAKKKADEEEAKKKKKAKGSGAAAKPAPASSGSNAFGNAVLHKSQSRSGIGRWRPHRPGPRGARP